jgi:hypothetical protein
MMKARRLALPTLVAAALLAPACGGNSVTLPDVFRATIQFAVDPAPVPGIQNSLTGAVSAAYKVTIAETGGLGGEVVFVSSSVFDPETGLQVALSYFDSADLVVFVGSKRIEAGGTLVVPQTVSYVLPDFRTAASLTVSIQVKDDRNNLFNLSQLVKIE